MFSSFLRHTNHQKAFALSVVSLSLSSTTTNRKKTQTEAALPKEEELFENQCLKRQLFQPKLPYPAWDYDWDGHSIPGKNDLEGHKTGKARKVKGKTRHIILVRHGQYDESSQEDKDRILTQLGRLQATKTGQRLAEWAKGYNYFEDPDFNGPLTMVPTIHVSNMTRAKETAQLICQELQKVRKDIHVASPDPMLNEALPSPMIPIRPDIQGATEEIDQNHDRIEKAFQHYFYRDVEQDKVDEDEFEIIVCHGNVIRYFFCRALQLPPEAWLRMSIFNCSLTYLMIRPNGTVSARMLGDIGHLNYKESTFSGNHGLKW